MNQQAAKRQPNNKGRQLLIIGSIILGAILLGWLVFATVSADRRAKAAEIALEQQQIEAAQRELKRDYEDLNNEFAQFENSRKFITDDSVKRDLNDKYEAARLQVEKLQQELNNQKRKSSAEIQSLRNEIKTLRALLKHYVEEIDRLNKENEQLRTENEQIKKRNDQLSSQVSETARKNEQLAERMTLAEKLNVTGLNLVGLNRKGKVQKKVSKSTQLRLTFTIPQNNSTPVGEKTIYMRITSPSGQLLGNGGKFRFEDVNLEYTARKTIEYAGEEMTGITIFYDVDTPLIAGEYTVELFADNFRLKSQKFDLR